MSLLASSFDTFVKAGMQPVYELLNVAIPALVGLGLGILVIFCIIKLIGMAKAEDDKEAAVKKKGAIICAISAAALALIVIVYCVVREPILQAVADALESVTASAIF